MREELIDTRGPIHAVWGFQVEKRAIWTGTTKVENGSGKEEVNVEAFGNGEEGFSSSSRGRL